MNMVSRSTAQSAESASLISRDFARVQQQVSEIGRILGANEPLATFNSSSIALTRLASKPSVLKETYDNFWLIQADQAARSFSFEQHTHRQSSNFGLASQTSCYCQKKAVAQQQATKFRNFYLIKKTTTSQRHLKGCAFAHQSMIATENARRNVYTGLRGLLSVALELSISWTSGAGGFSISPSITVRPIVDEATSPVFRVIMLMKRSAEDFWAITSPTDGDEEILVEQAFQHAATVIMKLYQTNRCSVYDVNVQGQSALYQWTAVSNNFQGLPLIIPLLNYQLKNHFLHS